MLDPKLPMELDDGRSVVVENSSAEGITVRVRGAVVRPSYTYDEAMDDGVDEEGFEYYQDVTEDSEDVWWYNRATGIFDSGNAHGFFVLRNTRIDLEPCETEGFFV